MLKTLFVIGLCIYGLAVTIYALRQEERIEALETEPCEDKRTDKRTETHACDYISSFCPNCGADMREANKK